MKNTISKSTLLTFSLMLLTLAGMESCKKDKDIDEPSLREQLAGEWEIKSFTVDGLELMGYALNSSILELEATNTSKGDYEWSFNYADGSNTDTNGNYEVDEDSKELMFDNNTASEMRYDIDLKDDNLEMSGTVDGSHYKLELERD